MVPQELPRTHEDIIAGAPKAVAHLRSQLERKRLGLAFGSGLSKDFQFPSWDELVSKLARVRNVSGTKLLHKLEGAENQRKSLSSLSQVMFGLFRDRAIRKKDLKLPLSFLEEQQIRSDWMRIIHGVLYSRVNLTNREATLNKHEYLRSFLPLIKKSAMTVNYNFDDTLEKLLLFNRTPEERLTSRGYETVFKPNAQFQKDCGVIYHPNGYLPSIFEDNPSPDLVFADDSFQDQMISVASGQYMQLSNYIFSNTCLLVGLSLTDSTLQHLLRQNAVNNPGHVHYLVHFVSEPKEYDHKTFEALFEANFTAYNLYTLFLDRSGIRLLAELVSTPSAVLSLRFPKGRHKFVYYIIGSIGAGKSTATGNLRCLVTYDEWIDERRSDMAGPEDDLSRQQIQDINDYTAEQFRKKNIAVSQNPNGIHLIDRCPLDPLTFGEPKERPEKAQNLFKAITSCGRERIQKGHIIYLDADVGDLRNRLSFKHKYSWDSDRLRALQEKISEVYKDVSITTLCTRGRSAQSVTREIAKIIFMGDYEEVDIGEQLRRFS